MSEQNKEKLHISVRNLVEFIFREGDIDNRRGKLPNADAAMEGSRLHRKIQQSYGAGYQAEVPLKYTVETDLYELTIDGRADGIFTKRRSAHHINSKNKACNHICENTEHGTCQCKTGFCDFDCQKINTHGIKDGF